MPQKKQPRTHIHIRGARENNLKDINVDIPRGKFTVVTGPSGSGKSTLAFNVIYSEGQRRYLEGLSAYARNFLDITAKPEVEKIDNLSPTIAIDQKSVARSPRSTVGTLTEISDYIRVLFAKAGEVHCYRCGQLLYKHSPQEVLSDILSAPEDCEQNIYAALQLPKDDRLGYVARLQKEGYLEVRINGKDFPFDELLHKLDTLNVEKDEVLVRIDRFVVESKRPDKERILDSINEAFDQGGGSLVVICDNHQKAYQRDYLCTGCDIKVSDLTPRNFSFNNPEGACPDCSGLGMKLVFDEDSVVCSPNLSLEEGALGPLNRFLGKVGAQGNFWKSLEALAKKEKISLSLPLGKLSDKKRALIMQGTADGEEGFVGVLPFLERKYLETSSEHLRSELEKYMHHEVCPSCEGRRLKPESLSIYVSGKNISQWSEQSLEQLLEFVRDFIHSNTAKGVQKKIIHSLASEMLIRLEVLLEIGLGYLTLDRTSQTLSGGEGQRIRLAVQLISELSGVMYVLDEPSMGLHSRDTHRLIETTRRLTDADNTVIVVEHDRDIMKAADWIVDLGPGAGEEGGELVFSGTYSQLSKSKTLTAQYLLGKKRIEREDALRSGSGKKLTLHGVKENNLKNISVSIPLNTLTVISGVSGSGKSSLVHDVLSRALRQYFFRAKDAPGKHKKITGLQHLDKVISVDQEPIGRTSRSNVSTYTGVFSLVRDVFAATPQAEARGYTASQFSFNLKGGRCEVCQGEGVRKIEMHLMPDMYIDCDACGGTRYTDKTLEIEYQDVNIAQVLDMSVSYAKHFFSKQPQIVEKLEVMERVGLGYLKLGQGAPDLSGGEAQRLKLATELARKSTGKTLYILDEPTIGLHFEDIRRLLSVLNSLVEKGNTVIIVEHNPEVIRYADWVVDLGPEGGDKGGEIVCEGAPEEIKKCKKSWTGRYL